MKSKLKKFFIKNELKRHDFRVSIFGSARIKEEDQIYKDTFEIGKELGKMGIDLITGGGPGLMEAASLGHQEGKKKSKNDHTSTIGLNIKLPFEQKPNRGVEAIVTHEHFSTRLDDFMLLSNVVVVTPGGIGTALEFFYTWQLIQVRHITRIPIVLVGEMWLDLIEWVKKWPLKVDYMNEEDMQYIFIANTSAEALDILKRAKIAFDEDGPEACVNWHLYGLTHPEAKPVKGTKRP